MRIQKMLNYVMLGLICCVLGTTSVFANAGTIGSVDRAKIMEHQLTKFIENIYWPTDQEINRQRIDNHLIPDELGGFNKMLHRVLRPEYLPTEDAIDSNLLAIENLRNNNDYLLLRYDRDQYNIQIQDGKALYILVSGRDDVIPKIEDICEYVKHIAFSLFEIPDRDESGNEPRVFVSEFDVGASKCGEFVYEASYPPPKYWYSRIGWWSDGDNVLFWVAKGILVDGLDFSQMAAPPPGYFAPRKFKKVSN